MPSYSEAWKTVNLGTGLKTADDFHRALKDGGFLIGNWAYDLLGRPAFTVATEKTTVDLVTLFVADLGFKNGATREDIYARAKELGLELCPAEVGPQLRLQEKNQTAGRCFIIGMEPIISSNDRLRVFRLDRNGFDQWLQGNSGHPKRFWPSRSRWVFVRPRKSQ